MISLACSMVIDVLIDTDDSVHIDIFLISHICHQVLQSFDALNAERGIKIVGLRVCDIAHRSKFREC